MAGAERPQGFLRRPKSLALQSAAIEKMYLIDMGNVDQGEGCINRDFRSGFFACFADGRLGRAFPFSMKPPGKVQ
jgi:hypothetical protein